jgi:methionine-rich copper-binding protein CopC
VRTNVLPWLMCRFMGMVLFGLILVPTGVMAHAILEQSQPTADGSVRAGRVDMSFSYNSRIDRDRSRLTLARPDHTQAVLGISRSGPPNVISTSTDIMVPGRYVVHWQVLAIDGHITRGDLPFTVTGQ